MAREGVDSGQMDWNLSHALSRAWELVALVTPVAAVILMVLKSALPTL